MSTIRVDCRQISTPEAFQIYLQYVMRFPDWYGRNLDALYDMLTEDAEPLRIVFVTDEKMSQNMKSYLNRVEQVLKDVENARNGFTFEIIRE